MEDPSVVVFDRGDTKNILTSLPKANKKKYCWQWLLKTPGPPSTNNSPSPPSTKPSKNRRLILGRQRRREREKKIEEQRKDGDFSGDESVPGINSLFKNNSKRILEEIGREWSFGDSGVSVVNTGRDSCLTSRTTSSLDSQMSRNDKKEEIPEKIRQYYHDFFEEELRRRLEEKEEKAMHEVREDGKTEEQTSSIAENEDEIIGRDDLEANNDYSDGDDNDDELKMLNGRESRSSQETIWPTESPNLMLGSENEFQTHTPESEAESEPEAKKGQQKKLANKWAWQPGSSSIRWTNVKPAIKPGVTASYYHEVNSKIRRAIFNSLSLRKPFSINDLKNRPALLACNRREMDEIQSARQLIAQQKLKQQQQQQHVRKRTYTTNSLPAIGSLSGTENNRTISRATYACQRDRIKLPEIQAHNLGSKARLRSTRKAKHDG
eukprot:gene1464-1618_t